MLRLAGSAKIVGMDRIPDVEEVAKLLEELKKEIKGEVYYKIYLRPNGDLIVEYQPVPSGSVVATLEFSPFRKSKSIPSQLKVVGRTDVLLARIHKRTYDALMLNEDGFLAEGSFSNVFLVKNEVLITPSIETGILSGITREIVIKVAKNSGLCVEERLVHPWEVLEADEVFLTHTSRGIVPVQSVQGFKFKVPGKLTGVIKEAFKSFVMERC